jgi:hypothetical protein
LRQFGLEGGDEIAAGGGGCVGGSLAADEDDAGGEGVGARADHAVAQFGAHRPGAADGETGFDHRSEEGVPAGIGCAVRAVAFGLLEGIVDGHGKRWMRLFGEPVHGLSHAIEEKGLSLLLAAVTVRSRHQFLGLGHGERGEKIGENGP